MGFLIMVIKTIEHHKNLDLADIEYLCEFDLIWKTEQWKDILNYEGLYKASDLGRVKGLKRTIKHIDRTRVIKEKIMKLCDMGKGYLVVTLSKNGIQKNSIIHQLVAVAFLNHTPNGWDLVVNHINFIRYDNRIVNLEIVTTRENANQKHLPSSSKYVGVCWDKKSKKWQSTIVINKKNRHLGYFNSEIEASECYKEALFDLLNKKNEKTPTIEVVDYEIISPKK